MKNWLACIVRALIERRRRERFEIARMQYEQASEKMARYGQVDAEMLADDEMQILSSKETAVHRGSGDFLRDMGYADPDEMRDKFVLANAIALAAERIGIERAAAATGLTVDRLSAIVDGRVQDVTIGDLRRALSVLMGS